MSNQTSLGSNEPGQRHLDANPTLADPILAKPSTPAFQVEESNDSDNDSVASTDSDGSVMEPFVDYKPKIEKLLDDFGLSNFDVEELQHGLSFQNCVYALTSTTIPDEQFILRVPQSPDMHENSGCCEAIINDAALLAYLVGKLPVPEVKAYSATEDNALGTPFTIQKRISGIPLSEIYSELTYKEKESIVDQFIDLLAEAESVRFSTAGTFTASSSLPTSTHDFNASGNVSPSITLFDKGDEDFVKDPKIASDRAGTNLKALLTSHINGWIEAERKHTQKYQDGDSLTLLYWEKMLAMLDQLDREGAFASNNNTPIVLHHWDLEPRNIMVSPTSPGYAIVGIIDWDDAIALPRPLARKPPAWIWDFDSEAFTGYLDIDHHPSKTDLVSEKDDENAALKAHFDARAAAVLGQEYLDDAYGNGRWLRRIWTFARGGVYSTWYLDLIKELVEDWEKRPQPSLVPLVVAAEPEPHKLLPRTRFLGKWCDWIGYLGTQARTWL
ncbi:MAG: hypothetical protein LQ343_002473 [Gyalolechia ehrenbergii]|nr:MAG: hypothetical protein LQ343_002473 [Gyalolechia ehrenbergii]